MWDLLRCVTTNGEWNICCTEKKFSWTNIQCFGKHKVFKTYGCLLYYTSAGTLCKIFESIMCYWTRSVNSELHLLLLMEPLSFCELLSKLQVEYPDLPYHTSSWMAYKWQRFIFELRAKTEILLNEKYPWPLLLNAESLWQLVFVENLITFDKST